MKRKRDAPTLLQSCMFLNTTPVLAVAGHCCSSLDCSHVTTKVMLLCLYLFLGSTNDYWQPLDRDDHEGCRVEGVVIHHFQPGDWVTHVVQGIMGKDANHFIHSRD
ncbi:hypothetical protein NC652_012095 [Populus alba x Populus x berolinensis]|uniref:Uncharacterized protein n=1 Tax=Populus alba x Populus x berolinensis TaxID=444605 RepID=A0AAD6R575_9ROSI|nr:hypothetical protein NC652_012078 [Populus alba x Populus x berolinensis]KAJ6937685.1 hypothetical protein NC652_012095 [Populus alba x Populus x berolinensis]KAJ7001994.1 hypothetical protein NC653_012154 [Populus alba x Populus x berolinensis]KAJ7002005.1 hypothetical protein NC653_012162 [Populus alba x Populus x berolinensis]KAJ7002015.1 hypothetical protein NC653_012169 [Populus alba x Populus x berolinensis]